ncbi:hypothetical protein HK102_004891 [Quaeritorhiza haematococci]|nr:hypothetical protein HK102_004891 [Quaeritorhiza haematococci]
MAQSKRGATGRGRGRGRGGSSSTANEDPGDTPLPVPVPTTEEQTDAKTETAPPVESRRSTRLQKRKEAAVEAEPAVAEPSSSKDPRATKKRKAEKTEEVEEKKEEEASDAVKAPAPAASASSSASAGDAFRVVLERWVAKTISEAFPAATVDINPKKPRSKSFEISIDMKGEEHLVWTGIKKTPRKEKFPDNDTVVELIKSKLGELAA